MARDSGHMFHLSTFTKAGRGRSSRQEDILVVKTLLVDKQHKANTRIRARQKRQCACPKCVSRHALASRIHFFMPQIMCACVILCSTACLPVVACLSACVCLRLLHCSIGLCFNRGIWRKRIEFDDRLSIEAWVGCISTGLIVHLWKILRGMLYAKIRKDKEIEICAFNCSWIWCCSHSSAVLIWWTCIGLAFVSLLLHPAVRVARYPVRFLQGLCRDPDLFCLDLFGPRFVRGCGILLLCLFLWAYQKIALLCLRIHLSTYPPWEITSLRNYFSKKSIFDVCKDAKIVHLWKCPPWIALCKDKER